MIRKQLWQSNRGLGLVVIGMTMLCVNSVVYGQGTPSDENDTTTLVFAIREPKGISDIVANRDGTTVFTTSYGTRPKMWDVATGKLRADTSAKDFAVDVGFNPDGRIGISTGWSRTQLWDTASGKPSGPRLKHIMDEASVIMPACSDKGNLIATVDSFDTVRVWDIKTGKPRTAQLPHPKESVSLMKFSPDGRRLVTLAHGNVRVWDIRSSRLVTGPIKLVRYNRPVLNRDVSRMLVRENDETLKIIDLQSGKPIGGPLVHESYARVSHPFGLRGLILTSDNHGAYLWSNCDTDEPRSERVLTSSRVHRVLFLPDIIAEPKNDATDAPPPKNSGRFLTFSDSKLAVWRVGRKEPLWEKSFEGGSLTASRDGRWLLVRSRSKRQKNRPGRAPLETAFVFDTATGRKVFEEDSLVTATIECDLILTGSETGANIWRLPR